MKYSPEVSGPAVFGRSEEVWDASVFGGIFNRESTAKFVSAISEDTHDPDAFLTRCNIIQLDSKKPSKDGDVYVFMDLAYYGQHRIHCQHFTEATL